MEREEVSLLKKIKLTAGRKVNTLLTGEYHSAFKGMGLSFNSVREYSYGDDARDIDWNVSARMNHLFIREYIEERELSVVLMIDASKSTDFGSSKPKRNAILETAALFLYLAQMNKDRISVIMFTDRVEKFIRPKKGRKFILKTLDEIVNLKPRGARTDISSAIEFARMTLKKRSIVFLISDFMDTNPELPAAMRHLAGRHDLIPVQVFDPFETENRFFGLVEFLDLESGKIFTADCVPSAGALPSLNGFDPLKINASEPVAIPVLRYFEKRNRKRRAVSSRG